MKGDFYLSVNVYVDDFDKLQRIAKYLKNKGCRVQEKNHYEVYSTRKEARHSAIMRDLTQAGPILKGMLYRRMRRDYHYGEGYKTFQRDVAFLILEGKVIATKTPKSLGNSTILEINYDASTNNVGAKQEANGCLQDTPGQETYRNTIWRGGRWR